MGRILSSKVLLIVGLIAVVGLVAVLARPVFSSWGSQDVDLEALPVASVETRDLAGTITALGYAASGKATEVECELQELDAYVRGPNPETKGSSSIIWVIPNGTMVKEGDLLMELDSSNAEEVARIHEIATMRAVADYEAAQKELEVAKIALKEFEDGVRVQTSQVQQSSIVLSESELFRAGSRLEWTERMSGKGYASRGQLLNDKEQLARSKINLENSRKAQEVYLQYTVPKMRSQLENAVLAAESDLKYQQMRLKRYQKRLDLLNEQIERCKIFAPHDGFVVYARDRRRSEPEIVVGNSVRQGQDLFELPDLNDMKVEVQIHESFINRVEPGMPAEVTFPSIPGVTVTGTIERIDRFPMPKRTWSESGEVKNYQGFIELDEVPEGLKPGATARVSIRNSAPRRALTVPVEAVAVREDGYFCYVAGTNGLECREVELGSAENPGWLEIAEGLDSGELVVLDPSNALEEAGAETESIEVVYLPEPEADPAEERLIAEAETGDVADAGNADETLRDPQFVDAETGVGVGTGASF